LIVRCGAVWVFVYGAVGNIVYGYRHTYWCPIIAFIIVGAIIVLTIFLLIIRSLNEGASLIRLHC
jgi:hypothetical protein